MNSPTETKYKGYVMAERPDLVFKDEWRGWHDYLGLKGDDVAAAYHAAAYLIASLDRKRSIEQLLAFGPAAERRFRQKGFRPKTPTESLVNDRLVWAKIEVVADHIRKDGAPTAAQVRKIVRQIENDIRQAEAGG